MEDIEVRRLAEADVPAAAALTARIFASGEAEQAGMTKLLEAAYTTCPFMPPSLCWGAFVEGRLAAKWQILDFRVRVAGNVLRVAGIQGVVAAPDDNFKGYPALIAAEALPEVIAEGFSVVMGFAQRGGLYVKLGGVPIAPEYNVAIDPRSVPRLAPEDDPFHEADEAGDVDFMLDLYNAINDDRTGSFVRTREYWPWMVRKPARHWVCDDGYVGANVSDKHVDIKEVGGSGAAFYDLAVRKLATVARDRGVTYMSGRIPPDHPFCDAARRYGIKFETTVPKRSGCIGMVIDPAGFAEAVRPGLDARCQALGLGGVELAFGGGGFDAVMALGEGSARKIPLAVPASSLLQWCFGFRPVSASLVEHGATASDEDLALLERLFPVAQPFTWGSDRF